MRKRDLCTQGYPPLVRVFKRLFAQRSALRHFKYRQVRIFGETAGSRQNFAETPEPTADRKF